MSHDRGCPCGRERWDYDECRDPTCNRRGRGQRGEAALNELRRRAEMTTANARQVGGDHYKTASNIQHWDLVEDHGLGYLEGCATKYLSRWRKKNGVQDLEKALHYTDKLLELALSNKREPRGWVPFEQVAAFAKDYNLDLSETSAVLILCNWRTTDDLLSARNIIQQLLTRENLKQPPAVAMAT